MSEQVHRSDSGILGRRTLEQDHRVLAALLRPGMAVLDVGCGTGAITAGIAARVGLDGRVVGLDRDEVLLAEAQRAYGQVRQLRFEVGDVAELGFEGEFDVVTAARVLQWVADPQRAVMGMRRAAKAGGMVLVLDYSHARNTWSPEPPGEFRKFWEAFLQWRAAQGWDNRMADHLPELFRAAGLVGIEVVRQDEVAVRGEADFAVRAGLWGEVMGGSVGAQLVAGEYLSAEELRAAREVFAAWVEQGMEQQVLALAGVCGVVA